MHVQHKIQLIMPLRQNYWLCCKDYSYAKKDRLQNIIIEGDAFIIIEELKTCPMELDVYKKIQKLLQSGFSWKMQFIRMDGNKITDELSKLKAPFSSIFKQSLPDNVRSLYAHESKVTRHNVSIITM